jgi:hypothetical protein
LYLEYAKGSEGMEDVKLKMVLGMKCVANAVTNKVHTPIFASYFLRKNVQDI